MRSIALFISIAMACLLSSWAYSHSADSANTNPSAKSVLVSIHPLALLVKTAWPQLQVDTLVKANQSPHDFTLKPSDIKALKSADAVVWLGPEFEPYLSKLLKQGKSQVNLAHFEDEHGHQDHADAHHDPHLWLQPMLLPEILANIQQQLNLPQPKQFLKLYDTWLAVARFQMSDKTKTGFVSYHDAFAGWVTYFNLNQLAIMAQNPEKPVGTRHVLKVRSLLEANDNACLLVEPQFQGRLLNKLKAGLDVRLVKIDPMASTYQIKNANFLDFYSELLKQFSTCLKP